jgi:hypothetical protein
MDILQKQIELMIKGGNVNVPMEGGKHKKKPVKKGGNVDVPMEGGKHKKKK